MSERERQRRPDAQPGATSASPTGAREAALGREPNRLKRGLKLFGPGLIAGASDDDPTAIATYATAGAAFGYAMLWTPLLTFPMMAAVQFICSKIGMETGESLAGVLRRHTSRWFLYPAITALLIANVINVAADLGAIAAAVNLFAPVPITVLIVPIALVILAFQAWGSYRTIERTFKWLTLALLAYVGAAFLARPDAHAVLRGTFVPTIQLDGRFLATLMAIFGGNVSPYLFFWQATEEVEEKVSMGRRRLRERKGTTETELSYAAWDTNIGMAFSNLVIYFIELATAATLFAAGHHDVDSATQAARALEPLAGRAGTWLFGLGLIGAGLITVPVLTATGAYAVAELFGWRRGLERSVWDARRFYGVIAASTLVGLLLNFVGINPMKALVWAAAINGVLAPPMLVAILLLSNDRRVMGDRVNGMWTNVIGWATAVLMAIAAVLMFVTLGRS